MDDSDLQSHIAFDTALGSSASLVSDGAVHLAGAKAQDLYCVNYMEVRRFEEL